jgi:ATP-dependent DNA helicase RecG
LAETPPQPPAPEPSGIAAKTAAVAPAAGTSRPPAPKRASVARPRAATAASGTRSKAPLTLDAPVTALASIRGQSGGRLANLGVRTLEDLLYLFPRRYDDYRDVTTVAGLRIGQPQSVQVVVWEAARKFLGARMQATELVGGDETGNLKVVWFNQPYLAQQFPTGTVVMLSGAPVLAGGFKKLESPDYEIVRGGELLHTARLVPVYPLTHGLSGRTLRAAVKVALDALVGALVDPLPEGVRRSLDLWPLSAAVRAAHFPSDWPEVEQARRRLAFDELFVVQLGMLQKRRAWQEGLPGEPLRSGPALVEDFVAGLPFGLTSAQHRVLGEILGDLDSHQPMTRLLQGEVGSGKTVVAAAAIFVAARNGFQTALMAPTEILAEQHFKTLSRLLAGWGGEEDAESGLETPGPDSATPYRVEPLRVALLTGSTPAKEKRRIKEALAAGQIDVVVGTHALIVEGVEFQRLGLVIVDEQHRFGVEQRQMLRQKSHNPHLLVMTATPIPRTLALTLYGDLDLSVIDQMPPGRQVVDTFFIRPEQRDRAYEFVRKEVVAGRQAFVICPLIEESEEVEARAATVEYERLKAEVFPELRLELLHGRMKAKDKEAVMRRFRDRETDILVSTTVIEVGIDIPNATVMLIEGADRFGLAQLHQLRGRVGRGKHKSYCLLLAESASEEATRRLKVVAELRDGFALAEEDLSRRGPGEFFGTRQSGLPALRMARLSDVHLLEAAREQATAIFRQDPDLARPEHAALGERVRRLWQAGADLS